MHKCTIIHDDCLEALKDFDRDSIDLIYTDPPYNTGQVLEIHGNAYRDHHEDYEKWMFDRIVLMREVMKQSASLYLQLDWREVHYIKVMMDKIFGRDNFVNEIIWAYDFGGRTKSKWPTKHDTILMYAKRREEMYFDYDSMDRIPYMAPGLQKDAERIEKGKTPTDTWMDIASGGTGDIWWQTIVPTNSRERVGYPTQKPIQLANRILKVSCPPGGTVLDCFAGSGTVGDAARMLSLNSVLIDTSPQAIEVMLYRIKPRAGEELEVEYIDNIPDNRINMYSYIRGVVNNGEIQGSKSEE